MIFVAFYKDYGAIYSDMGDVESLIGEVTNTTLKRIVKGEPAKKSHPISNLWLRRVKLKIGSSFGWSSFG